MVLDWIFANADLILWHDIRTRIVALLEQLGRVLLRVLGVRVVRGAGRTALGRDSKLLTVTCHQLVLILSTLPMDLGQAPILLKLEGFGVLGVVDVFDA